VNDPRFHFHTNLDEAQRYVEELNAPTGAGTRWILPYPPSVGDEISFQVHKDFRFPLRVVAVRWSEGGRACRVELHMPTVPHSSIREWMDWFERRRRES
jgi:hypothetical protein